MSNKRISELPYINGSKISGNTLVPLVTYFSATTGDTVHTYIDDFQTYLISGLTGNTDVFVTGGTYSAGTITFTNNTGGTFNVTGVTFSGGSSVSGDYLPLSGGTVTGGTQYTAGLTANTISATTYQNLPTGYYDTTGITTSQSITWDKTYWGISATTNVDLTLPSTTSKDGYILIIKDEAGIAGLNRIRLTPITETIDGNPFVDMNINNMSLTIMARNNNWQII